VLVSVSISVLFRIRGDMVVRWCGGANASDQPDTHTQTQTKLKTQALKGVFKRFCLSTPANKGVLKSTPTMAASA
jgi:hypothetical protein